MRVSVDVEVDTAEVLEDATTRELADELVSRTNWTVSVHAALKAKSIAEEANFDETTDLDDLLRDWSMGFPVNEQLSALCRQRLGLTIPVRN